MKIIVLKIYVSLTVLKLFLLNSEATGLLKFGNILITASLYERNLILELILEL